MHMHMLHCDLLLALAAVAVERVQQHSVGARELVRLAQALTPASECLFADHSAPVALHRGIVCGEELSRDHSLHFVFRPDANERREGCAVLTVAGFFLRMSEPKRGERLIGKKAVPIIELRSADEFQAALQGIRIFGPDCRRVLVRGTFFRAHRYFLMLECPSREAPHWPPACAVGAPHWPPACAAGAMQAGIRGAAVRASPLVRE